MTEERETQICNIVYNLTQKVKELNELCRKLDGRVNLLISEKLDWEDRLEKGRKEIEAKYPKDTKIN